MDSKNLIQSRKVRLILRVVIGVVVALLIFQIGVSVGYRKAMFSSRLGDNYRQAFGRGPMMPRDFDLPGGHGAVGQVVKTATSSIIVADRDNVEKIISLTSETIIRLGRETATTTNIKVGDSVVVVGAPDQSGQIEARLIRILPSLR